MCHLGLRTLKMYFYVLKLERCVAAAIKFLNKMSGQTCCQKSQTSYNLGGLSSSFFFFPKKEEEKTLLVRCRATKSYISDVIQRTIKIQEATPTFASS